MPGRSMPGQRRANRRRAGRQHELVVGLGGDLAGRDVAQLDGLVLRARSRSASQPVRQSTLKCRRNTCSLATSRSDSCSITLPTWYGRPQFAYDTYGPRSTMRISASSSSRRSRAAHDAPPATPPTMITFISLPHSPRCMRVVDDSSDPRAAPAAVVGDERVGGIGPPRTGRVAVDGRGLRR